MKKEKEKFPLIITIMTMLVIIALMLLIFLPAIKKITTPAPAMPEEVTYCGKVYSARDFLVGCIMYNMTVLSEPPNKNQQEGINAAACCLKSSVIYLCSRNQLSRESFPAVYFVDCTDASIYFGSDYPYYLESAEKAADYALSRDDTKALFLPVCPLSSGGLIDPASVSLDMPHIKRLYCPKDEGSPFFEGSCQLTENGIAEKLLSAFPSLIIPPVEKSMITDIKTDDSGNVLSLNCCGINMSGFQFIRLFDIRAVNFKMSRSQNLYTFRTRGVGDSIGMSFNAALKLSESGMSCDEIMNTFFSL